MNQPLMKAKIWHRISPVTLLMILVFTGLAGMLTFVEITDNHLDADWFAFMLMFFGVPVATMLAGYLTRTNAARNSSLELYDDVLSGSLTSGFNGGVRSFRIPLDQIISVNVKSKDTLLIRSTSGTYKVKDVENAQPFANSVMMQTDRYRAMLMQAQQPMLQAPPQAFTPAYQNQAAQRFYTENDIMEASRMGVQAGMAAAEQNTVQKLQTLEKLRADGLITQEEYDRKKSEFLAQI